MLKIERRNFTFGEHMNVRTEKHGDGKVDARDVRAKTELPREIVDTLIGGGAAEAFWRKGDDGLMYPRFDDLAALSRAEPIKECRVTVWARPLLDEGKPCVFENVTLGSVKLSPKAGGVVELAFTLQTRPTPEQRRVLDECMRNTVELEVECSTFGETPAKGDASKQADMLSDAA